MISESPSFIGSLNAFRSFRSQLIGVEMGPDGIDTEKLEQALKANPNTKFIYTIPNFQNPTGITMSLEKRKEVYRLALQYGVLILEDNPYGELRFSGEDVPTIKSMDTEAVSYTHLDVYKRQGLLGRTGILWRQIISVRWSGRGHFRWSFLSLMMLPMRLIRCV